MINEKIFVGVAVLALLIGGVVWYFITSPESSTKLQPEESTSSGSYEYGRELSETEVVEATEEVLDILDQLYFVTQDTTSSVEPDTTSMLVIQMTTESLTDKKAVDNLLPRAQRLSDSDNQILSTVGMGLFAGLGGLSKAEEDFAQYLRTVDPVYADLAEFQYQLASFNSAQKEAFKLMGISGGQLPLLFWNSAENDNPSGPIPYRLGVEARQKLLSKIDYLFADDIVADERNHTLTGSTNAVIFLVKHYRDNLTPDTYEEAAP